MDKEYLQLVTMEFFRRKKVLWIDWEEPRSPYRDFEEVHAELRRDGWSLLRQEGDEYVFERPRLQA